ncbi:MAG TPA: tetratricopeptide repeat protein [Thiolapillus brandeum]|uniref:Tetratricopeptide repeat protein n=1 Tax=Thiolapillus brandeum TaxID=1076588 RepID=A0A831RVC6_9GAMM|nr:tetratricopeptide repeat protein [Thiolapillus brandeum]
MPIPAKYLFFIMLLPFALASCATHNGVQPAEKAAEKPAAPATLPFKSTAVPPKSIDKELLFNYLAGEISVQRGAWEAAYEHLLLAAREAKDAVAASKAARLAWRQDDMKRATRATKLWIEYDPNALSARQLAMLAALRNDDMDTALEQAHAMLLIAKARGKDGFLLLSSALATTKNRNKLLLIQDIARQYAGDARAQYALALVSSQEKEFITALQALDEAQKIDPQWDKPYLLRVQIFAMQGDEAGAEKLLREAADKYPSPALLEAYGRLLMQQKHYEEALKYFRKALDLNPKDHELLYVVGVLALQTKDWDLARSTWEQLRDNPRYHKEEEAWYFLGQLEELRGNLKQATENYSKVKAGRLRNDAQIRTAILTGKLGNLEESHELFNALRLTDPDQAVQIYITEAQLLKDLHKPESALKIYDEAINAYPQDADLLYARGLLAADLGDIEKAEADFKAALAIKPDDSDALNALGYTLADQTDRYEEAYAYVKKALELDPESPAILDSMGWVLFRMKEYSEALKYLRLAAEKLDDPEIFAHLGEALWTTGAKKEARDILDKASKKYPENPKLKDALKRLQ